MKVSLITVTYNSGATLKDTIESVLSQDYNNIEYIIIDGKSTDNTLNIIQKYEPLFSGRIKYISEKDNGLYDAMNKGIMKATGDIIGILNSDDFFTTNNIITQITNAFKKNSSIDAVYGDIHFVNPNDLNKCVRYYSSRIFKRSLMRLGFMPAHPSFYIKRECILKYGLYKTHYKIAADFEFLLRTIFVHKIKTLYLPIDMVTMRTGGASTAGLKSYKQIMREHLKAFKENHVFTNRMILSLRYIYKITGILFTKIAFKKQYGK